MMIVLGEAIHMTKRFAYSLNGNDWAGDFSSRKEARLAALEAARSLDELPATVFVGAVIAADPQIAGHARELVGRINSRAESAGTGEYLNSLKVEQVEDLDREITGVLQNWLVKHKLLPTSFHVNAISEYPVPLPPTVTSGPSDEVRDIGQNRDVQNFQ
jgi:hypothetical protein